MNCYLVKANLEIGNKLEIICAKRHRIEKQRAQNIDFGFLAILPLSSFSLY